MRVSDLFGGGSEEGELAFRAEGGGVAIEDGQEAATMGGVIRSQAGFLARR